MWAQHWLISISVDREDDVILATPSSKERKCPPLFCIWRDGSSIHGANFLPPAATRIYFGVSLCVKMVEQNVFPHRILEFVSHNYLKREGLLSQRVKRKFEGFVPEHTHPDGEERSSRIKNTSVVEVLLCSKCKDGSLKKRCYPELLLSKSNTSNMGSLSEWSVFVLISF